MITSKVQTSISDFPSNDKVKETSVDHVFTLVHGTWARSTLFRLLAKLSGTPVQQWYGEGSMLRKRLESQFCGAVFQTVEWSGGNSVRAREQGAIQLAKALETGLAQYQSAQHFIIAHSHGGNIAYYALRARPDLISRIAGIISLSTPFLFAQWRGKSTLSRFHLLLSSFQASSVVFLFPMIVTGMLAANLVDATDRDLFSLLWGYVSLFSLLLMFIWVSVEFRQKCFRLIQSLRLPSLSPQLIVRTAADEASGALGICQVGVWLIHKSLTVIFLPVLLAERIVNKTTIATFRAYSHLTWIQVVLISVLASSAGALTEVLLSSRYDFQAGLGLRSLFLPLYMWAAVRYIEWNLGSAPRRVPVETIFVTSLIVLVPEILITLSPLSLDERSALANIGVWACSAFAAIYFYNYIYRFAKVLATVVVYYGYFLLIGAYISLGAAYAGTWELAIGIVWVIFMLPVAIATFLTGAILGPKFSAAYIYIDLSVESAPPGAHTIHQFGFRGDLKQRIRSSLNHSLAYETPEIITAITEWIRQRIKAAGSLTNT